MNLSKLLGIIVQILAWGTLGGLVVCAIVLKIRRLPDEKMPWKWAAWTAGAAIVCWVLARLTYGP